MKNNKMITLDVKLIEKLQETKNVSKLIEGLLMDYFLWGRRIGRRGNEVKN